MTSRNDEMIVLRISTYATVVFAVIGVAVAIYCDSMTLMLDGLYSTVDVIVSFIALRVVRKIHEPPDSKYHYGYAKYEPFMTGLDGILIMAICGGTIVAGIQDLVHPEPIDHAGIAVFYALLNFSVSMGFGIYVKKKAKKFSSEILRATAELWFIEGLISGAVFIAFGIGLFVEHTVWRHYVNYIDPAMCILFSIFLLSRPIKVLIDSFRDLVDESPGGSVESEVMQMARQYCEKYHLTGIESAKIRKAGRHLFIFVCFKAHQQRMLHEMHEITEGITSAILKLKPRADVSVSFRC